MSRDRRMNEYDIFNHELVMGIGRSSGTVGTSGLDTTKDSQPTIDEYQLTKVPQGKTKQHRKNRKSIMIPPTNDITERIKNLQQNSEKKQYFESAERKISIQ